MASGVTLGALGHKYRLLCENHFCKKLRRDIIESIKKRKLHFEDPLCDSIGDCTKSIFKEFVKGDGGWQAIHFLQYTFFGETNHCTKNDLRMERQSKN